MEKKKTLVLGASANAARYSYLAIQRLRMYEHPVVAIGKRNAHVADVNIEKEKKIFEDVDTITLYLNRVHQTEYYDYIISLKPKRLIFNPGAENSELENLARRNNIETMDACTLVLLSTGQY